MSKPRKRRDFGSLPQNSNIQTSQYVIVRGDEGLAFPSLLTVAASIIVLAIFLPAVHLLSKGLKVQTKLIPIPEPKRGATLSSLVILVSFVAVFLWRVSTHMLQLDTCSHIFSVDPTCPGVVVDVVDVPWLLVLQAPILLGVFVVMKRTGRNIASIGVDRKDWRRMLVLGGTVSAIFVTISGLLAPSLGGGFAGFSASLAYGLVFFAIVGFSEEIVWRGYVQTRLTAYLGRLEGLVISSLLFAVLWHFPSEYYAQSGAILAALAGTLTRIPPGLLFGYLMLRSQNILPSSIFHLFWDWNIILWQVPTA